VPERNRVTRRGEVVAIDPRGLFMGNRGCMHRDRRIVRPWQVRRWITCVLEYKGWVAPKWEPGRWTPLFFWDEAVALAAGPRPCALCRRADFNPWLDGWQSVLGERPKVDPMDRCLHTDHRDGNIQRLTRRRRPITRGQRLAAASPKCCWRHYSIAPSGCRAHRRVGANLGESFRAGRCR
jgi:hypothetical protein